jgi:hypothetical protein
MSLLTGNSKNSVRDTVMHSTAAAALLCAAGVVSPSAIAQDGAYDPANYAWQAGANAHAQKMRTFTDPNNGQQPTPPVIPQIEFNPNPSGFLETAQPGGPTQTSQNAFFANLGINNRTCFTCRQPQTGWGVSAASVQARFYASYGNDPIFRLFDGATCPTDDVSSISAKVQAYYLVLTKGLIRIGLPVPATVATTGAPTEYRITAVSDPYGCNTNPVTGLTNYGTNGPTTGIVSVYRRPLPSTNLGFLTTIMWDGREPGLTQQSIDATTIHAQAATPPTVAQQQQIVAFESGLFTAEAYDFKARDLTAAGATGGPNTLINLLPGFFIGINDPLGGNRRVYPSRHKSSISIRRGITSPDQGRTSTPRARQSRAAKRCSTIHRSPSLASRVSTTNPVSLQSTDSVAPAMTPRMSATIRSNCQ